VIWLKLVIAAFGGGVLATLLELWVRDVREYERARLQVLNELDTINAMPGAIKRLVEQIGEPEGFMADLARMSYPTRDWTRHRAAMVTRLRRGDPELLHELSALFAALIASPYPAPLREEMLSVLPEINARLKAVSLGRVGAVVVYGPRYRP
jgi:hypothetical protein